MKSSHHPLVGQHHHHPIVGQEQQQCMVAGQPSSAVFSDWSQTGRRPATRPNILFGFLSTSSRIVSNFHVSCLHFYTLYVILFRILRGNLKTSPKPTGNLILLNMISKDKVDRLHSQVDHVCPDKSKFELLEAERSILGKKDGRKCFLATGKSQNQRHRPRFCRKHPAKPQHPPGQPSHCFWNIMMMNDFFDVKKKTSYKPGLLPS